MFKIKATDNRERDFYYYVWRHKLWGYDFFPRIDHFVVKGDVFKPDSWKYCSLLASPDSDYRTGLVDLGVKKDRKYLGPGWSGNKRDRYGRTFVRALGGAAYINISIPKEKEFVLKANLLVPKFDHPQEIKVFVDGEELGRWFPVDESWKKGWKEYLVTIPPSLHRPPVSLITFRFSKFRPIDSDYLIAAMFDYVTIHEK